MESNTLLAANNLRILAAAMVEKAKSGHPGGAMGGADFIHILYSEFLRYNPANPLWELRDRFFLDPGHMSAMLYSVLALCGYYSLDDLQQFRQWQSVTPGHPELDVLRGVENTSGPLGQGHAMAVGAAIAERFFAERFGSWCAHKIYTYISDGGIQEEVSQGAGRLAGFLGLHNLVMFYDANNVQLSTMVSEVSIENVAKKYEAWGWMVLVINGNNHAEIREALQCANAQNKKPTLIIGNTIMGWGAVDAEGNSFEGRVDTHGQPLSNAGASFTETVKRLGGDPNEPFKIFDEVARLYANRKAVLQAEANERIQKQTIWAQNNADLALKWQRFFSKKAPAVNLDSVKVDANGATRNASGRVLEYLAEKVDHMIVMSADLANSDKTDGFLKKTTAFKYQDFSGAFLHAGVCELTMACVMNGMALHGGVVAVGGTFFVFSDYMKPAMRLAALMELPVKYVFTHDAFRVGEDGPTHQPIEHEAQIRLLEQLKNHSGCSSMLVLRPCDGPETVVAWHLALQNLTTPSALILSRQGIIDLPSNAVQTRQQLAWQASRGGYIVLDAPNAQPSVVLIGNGSEVATLLAGASLLQQQHQVAIRVVAVPSIGLFLNEPESYRNFVLPPHVPRFGLTAGLPQTLQGLVGSNGLVWGVSSFGYSAPYQKLDELFGFTAENVCVQVKALLKL